MIHRLISFAALMSVVPLSATVWLTSTSLPQRVASHFGAGGAANGFCDRNLYLIFMSLLVLVLPVIIGALPGIIAKRPNADLNIPNRDYWLAPERRDSTVNFISTHGALFAPLLAGFFVYINWLTVEANKLNPPTLKLSALVFGVVVLLAATFIWVAVLLIRFSRRA